MKHEKGSWFPRVGWEGFRKANNEAWKSAWVLHGSQELGGKGLGRQTVKHEKGLGCFSWFPRIVYKNEAWKRGWVFLPPRVVWEGFGKAKNEAWKGGWVLHGSQKWGGKGLGRQTMKHEKGFECFSWFSRIVYKNEAWKRGWVFLPPRVGWEKWSMWLKSLWVKSLWVKSLSVKSIWCKVCGLKVGGWKVYVGKSVGEKSLGKNRGRWDAGFRSPFSGSVFSLMLQYDTI